eukprot:TRINITY_DN48647_c0_g1_i6.p1 TRINITY_DN48647_c0_g1~~TRINITY_DN48647_c0_g1_i6.p1  ORF type:complete len:150 (+),score=18.06 TRINITY_DN48647_c0_g1_i6:156-605(+)
MDHFNSSLPFDKLMFSQDIRGSKAYAKAIAKAGLITNEECEKIVDGLTQVEQEWKEGKFVIKSGDEDIHTANERRLTELIGDAGRKLHTGRSRNDQVATDLRLWLREEIGELKTKLKELIGVAVEVGLREIGRAVQQECRDRSRMPSSA